MKNKAFILLIGVIFLLGINVSAQIETELTPQKSKVLSSKTLDKSFIQLIKTNDEVKTLAGHLNSKGFVAQRESRNFYGISETYKDAISKKQVTYKFQFQDFRNPNSKDLIALCHLSASSGKEIETYTFYLIAPNGDFDQMQEYFIDKRLNILQANSWWSCTKKRISNKCPGACLTAFITCVPAGASSVVGYLVCVVSNCAGCLIKAGACCACDCRWYCKWATGCCDK
jgi:hypothetical protein